MLPPTFVVRESACANCWPAKYLVARFRSGSESLLRYLPNIAAFSSFLVVAAIASAVSANSCSVPVSSITDLYSIASVAFCFFIVRDTIQPRTNTVDRFQRKAKAELLALILDSLGSTELLLILVVAL